jgi:tRNA threonylcarbamoyladenosine biosynthesis protein TsaB
VALILNIETSSPICSVCLSNNGKVLDMLEEKQGNSHARILTLFIQQLITANKIAFKQLDAVAVSAGPGSYTGLRIGASVAKGLCYALNKPLIAVSTLESLAKGMVDETNEPPALFMPMTDARRMDVYSAIYDTRLKNILSPRMLTVNEQLEKLVVAYGKVFIGGNAMFKAKQLFHGGKIDFLEDIECSARLIGTIADNKFNKKQFENPAYFQPEYLKEFEAKKQG